MARKRAAWTLVTPLAYRRPRRPERRVVLVATGLALSTVVAGLAVLGSIHPTPQSSRAHVPGPNPSTTPTHAVMPITTLPVPPNGIRVPVAYTRPRVTITPGVGGYVAPSLTPTDSSPPPPTQTSTDGNLTYTMTYDSGTVVVVYPSGGYPAGDSSGGGGRRGGGGHR
ncbi:MAG TPA: hypothetical protein VGM75_14615 [Pseudonocardiaceae bacterium]